MPYYEQFRKNSIKTIHKSSNDRRYVSTHDKKTILINSPIIIVVAIVLFTAFVFGIYKANEKNIANFIQSKTNTNLAPIDSLTQNGVEVNESRASFLKLPFKLFAKPEGDNGPIQEVTTDDGDDIVSTIIRQSALSYITNEDGGYLSKDSLRAFLPESEAGNFDTPSNTNNFTIDNTLQNEETKTIENTFNNAVAPTSKTNAKAVNQNINNRNEKIIEPKPFENILSPQNEKTKANIVSSRPARTPRREINNIEPKTEQTKIAPEAEKKTYSNTERKAEQTTNKRTVTATESSKKYFKEETVILQAQNNEKSENIKKTKPADKSETIILTTNKAEKKEKPTQQKIDSQSSGNKKDNADKKSEIPNIYKENNSVKQNNTYMPQNKSDEKQNIKNPAIERENNNKVYSSDKKYNANTNQSEKSAYIERYTENKKAPSDLNKDTNDKYKAENKSEKDNTVKRNISNDIIKTPPIENATVTRDNTWKVDTKKKTNVLKPRNIKLKPSIYLAEYDDKYGTITIIPRERNVGSDVSIETLILSLLEGANENEYKNNIISCIAKGTSLLDIFTDKDTAYLNFSSDFEYNPLGDEGLVIQIYQIVYTVTQFENINKVVFLIDGEHKEMIGSEGRILNKIFTRNVDDTLMTSE